MFEKPIFRNRNFMLLCIAQLISQIGNYVLEFALSWYIYDITGSTMALGASIISFFIPNAFLSLFSGVIADKHNRKKIIITCDIISGCVTLGLFGAASFTKLSIIIIIAFNIISSIISSMFNPAISAAIQSILLKDEYQDAGALTEMSTHFASVVGAALGGWMLKSIGVQYLLLFDGLSFIFAAILEYFLVIKKVHKVKENRSFKEDIGVAFKFLLNNKILLFTTLFAGIMANGMFMSLSLYMPGIFKDSLGKTSVELGFYFSIEGAVAAATSIYFVYTKKKLNPCKSVLITLALEGGIFLGTGLMKNLIAAYAVAILSGFSCSICSISCMTLKQLLTPNEIMGRTGSFGMLLRNISMPIFTLIFGALGEIFPLQNIVLIGGILYFICLVPAPFIFAKEKKGLSLSLPSQKAIGE